MFDHTRSDLDALHARLRREGLGASQFLIVDRVSSLKDVVDAWHGTHGNVTAPIVVLTAEALDEGRDPIVVGDIRLDPKRCMLTVRGREWLLRVKPASVLRVLMRNAGRPVLRDALVRQVWGIEREGANGPLRVYIHDLRRMIEVDPLNPRHIVTVRSGSVAYVFRP